MGRANRDPLFWGAVCALSARKVSPEALRAVARKTTLQSTTCTPGNLTPTNPLVPATGDAYHNEFTVRGRGACRASARAGALAANAGANRPDPRSPDCPVRVPVSRRGTTRELRSTSRGFSPRWGLIVSSTFLTGLALLAQADGAAGGSGLIQILTLVVPIGILFWLLLIRPQRKEQAQRQSLLAAIEKNDRVVTIGGIYGVVTNVHREADEVTIKVDEATNTKLRLTLGSIARVLAEESSSDK